jgi:hypothetical protein
MKLVVALIALLALAPVAEARKAPPRYMGMNWDGAIAGAPSAVRDAQFPRMASAGVETVRTTFRWADAQPVQGGPIDLSATDAFVIQTASRRIETLPIVIAAPDWARMSPAPLSPPRDGTLIEPYIRTLIARYGPSGSLWSEHPELPRVPIRYWQFWNEPHLPYQWDLPSDRRNEWPQTYASQLKVFHSTVKQADPHAKVVLGGLANFSWRYLAQLYRQGVHGNFEVAALHPYTTKPGAFDQPAPDDVTGNGALPEWLLRGAAQARAARVLVHVGVGVQRRHLPLRWTVPLRRRVGPARRPAGTPCIRAHRAAHGRLFEDRGRRLPVA